MPPRGRYLAHEVGQLAGVSGNKIGQWARHGFIRSSQSNDLPRVYSYQDVAEAMLVHELEARGAKPRAIHDAIDTLRELLGTEWPLTKVHLAVRDPRDVAVDDEVPFSATRKGQGLLGLGDDVQRIRSDLPRGGWAVRELPDLQYIEVNPDRLSGRPTIRGRRIAVVDVAELGRSPDGRATLHEDYELEDPEIDDALRWWQAVSRYEGRAAA